MPNSSDHWYVAIRDNEIEDIVKTVGIPYESSYLINEKEFTLDSKEALDIAKKDFILKPGDVWAIGYHFSISKEQGNILLQVICRDNTDKFTRISIDARTKQITDATHKISIGGGIFNGNDGSALVNNYDIDGITGITKFNSPENSNNLFAWGEKIINIIQYEPVLLYKKDNDSKWIELQIWHDINDVINTIIPISENSYFIICDKNIYYFNSKDIIKKLELNDSILKSGYYMDKIYILTKSELHISPDKGESWNKISLPPIKDFTNISFDINEDDNILYLAINNKIYCFDNIKWTEIINNDDIILDFKYFNRSIIYNTTDKNIYNYNLNTNEAKLIAKNLTIKKLIEVGQAYIYAITDEGKLFELKKESDKDDWITVDCNIDNKKGLVSDVLQIDENIWYYSTISKPEWVKLEKGE
ncbi:MAG: hypothetical protein WCD89_18750 [Anaerocolumna sp.]